jgi:hypothetical protein
VAAQSYRLCKHWILKGIREQAGAGRSLDSPRGRGEAHPCRLVAVTVGGSLRSACTLKWRRAGVDKRGRLPFIRCLVATKLMR